MNDGLVSVVIPVFNRPALLAETVQSVYQQTYRCVEIIIVNDGSTDHTGAVADDLRRDAVLPIRVLHQSNSGPGVARQKGLEQACGEYIQFLDSDDLLYPGKFAAQVAALQSKPECGISYGPSAQEDHATNPPRRDWPMRKTGMPISHLFPRLLIERWWTTSSPLYRHSLLATIGPWQAWINEEDWEYDGRCGATGTELAWVEEPCSIRRIHLSDEHLSDRGGSDPRKLADRAKARHSLFKSALAAGITLDIPEMKHFSRSVFLLSRQCADAGLELETKTLHALACRACSPGRVPADLLLYGWLGRRVGWRQAGRMSQTLRKLLPT